jgi:hypothetical protein
MRASSVSSTYHNKIYLWYAHISQTIRKLREELNATNFVPLGIKAGEKRKILVRERKLDFLN